MEARAMPPCAGVKDGSGAKQKADKSYSFRLVGNPSNPAIHVFEASIDALSYATILNMQERDWQSENLLSLGGVPKVAASPDKESIRITLAQYLADNPSTTTLRLHLDNDPAGRNTTSLLSTLLSGRYEVRIEPSEMGKDVNDHLLALTGRSTAESRGYVR